MGAAGQRTASQTGGAAFRRDQEQVESHSPTKTRTQPGKALVQLYTWCNAKNHNLAWSRFAAAHAVPVCNRPERVQLHLACSFSQHLRSTQTHSKSLFVHAHAIYSHKTPSSPVQNSMGQVTVYLVSQPEENGPSTPCLCNAKCSAAVV